MKDATRRTNKHRSYTPGLVLYFKSLLLILCLMPSIAALTPVDAAAAMRSYSYPALGFRVSFPTSWTVRDKRGDVASDHWVEGRAEAVMPSGLPDAKTSATSKEERRQSDIAFLKGIRVTILVRDINQLPVRMSLAAAVNNRIQGMKMMGRISGNDVVIKPVQQLEFSGVLAYITRSTEKYNDPEKPTLVSTFYDFERGALDYSIIITSPADEYDRYSADFNAIVQSFSFINRR